MAALDKFREKYPQYNELSDIDVATRLAKKYPDSYGSLLEKVKMEDLESQYAGTVTTTPQEQFQFKQLQKNNDIKPEITGQSAGRQMGRTAENIGLVYPVAEAAGAMATGAMAAPVAGLAGLGSVLKSGYEKADMGNVLKNAAFAGPFAAPTALAQIARGGDFKKAEGTQQAVQEALTYKPQTARGQEFLGTAMLPGQAVEKGKEAVLSPIAEAGYPDTAALMGTGFDAASMALGGKAVTPMSISSAKTALAKNARMTKQVVTDTMNKAIKPKFKSKKTTTKARVYDDKALTAIEELVRGKDKLELTDDFGRVVQGKLPSNAVEFQQAISKGKEWLFDEFTAAAEHATKKGYRVDTGPAAKVLDNIINSEVTGNFTPKTVEFAIERQNMLNRLSNDFSIGTKKGGLTPLQTQKAIKELNDNIQAYERSPSAANKSTAMVDAMITDTLRKSLDKTISKVPDIDYQAAKNKYSALKTIEDDVNKIANVDRNKIPGLPGFADALAGHQMASAVIKFRPEALAGAAAVKGTTALRNRLRDPNPRIKKMFKTVDKRLTEKAILEAKIAERSK